MMNKLHCFQDSVVKISTNFSNRVKAAKEHEYERDVYKQLFSSLETHYSISRSVIPEASMRIIRTPDRP